MSARHIVYVLRCADRTLYTGYTTDLRRRLAEHNGTSATNGGARYTRARRPVTLLYHEAYSSRSQAQQREAAIKRLPRQQKAQLVRAQAGARIQGVSGADKDSATSGSTN